MGQCSHAPGHEEVVIDSNIDGEVIGAEVDGMETAMEQGGEVMTFSGYQAAPVGTVSAAAPIDGSVAGVTVGAGGSVVSVPIEGSVAAVPIVAEHDIYDAAKDGQYYESLEDARKAAQAAENSQPTQPMSYGQPMHFQQPVNMHMQPHNFQQFPMTNHMGFHQQPNSHFLVGHQTHPEIALNNVPQQTPHSEVLTEEADIAVELPAEVVEAVVADADGVEPEVEDVEVAEKDEEKVTEEVGQTDSLPKRKKRFGLF